MIIEINGKTYEINSDLDLINLMKYFQALEERGVN
jgi:hypothetical protein